MHAEISGTVDFREKDDPACLARLKNLIGLLPEDSTSSHVTSHTPHSTARDPQNLYSLISLDGRKEYDARDLLACVIDAGTMDEYKVDYGKSLVCAYARLGGRAVG